MKKNKTKFSAKTFYLSEETIALIEKYAKKEKRSISNAFDFLIQQLKSAGKL